MDCLDALFKRKEDILVEKRKTEEKLERLPQIGMGLAKLDYVDATYHLRSLEDRLGKVQELIAVEMKKAQLAQQKRVVPED